MKAPATHAISTPTFTADWSVAAIHGRHDRGQVSANSDAPTAHSPPMPSAARKRKTISICQFCEKALSPVKQEYAKIVSTSARLRPMRSPMRPKKAPPSAQPTRNAALMMAPCCDTAGSFCGNCMS